MAEYLLGRAAKFIIFIIVAPLMAWLFYTIFRKRREGLKLWDPEVVFPTILSTALAVKLIHMLILLLN